MSTSYFAFLPPITSIRRRKLVLDVFINRELAGSLRCKEDEVQDMIWNLVSPYASVVMTNGRLKQILDIREDTYLISENERIVKFSTLKKEHPQ